MNDYRELIDRLRESVIGNKYPVPAMLLDAADVIETLTAQLTASEAARADLGKRLAAAEQELQRYRNTGLEPEEIKELREICTDEVVELARILYKAMESGEVDHLRELLQAEQDGRLVVLPCKVGDTIYYTREGRPIVEPIKVRTFFVGDPTRRGEILHLHMIRTDKFDVSMDALGKTVLLTREEAEAALAEKGVTKWPKMKRL